MIRTPLACAALALALLAAAPAAAQQKAAPQQQKPAETAKKEGNYGKTPDALKPYRGFREPYRYNFATKQPFLGAGRDKTPPPGLKTVRIGFMAPLDDASPEAAMGRRSLQGAQLAVEEANAAGGYNKLPFEMVIRDDVGPWGSASNKFVELNDEHVWAVLGSIDGQVTHIALRVALKLELPMVSAGSTDPTLTETRIPWYVRVNADDRQESYALANYIFNKLGYARVAMLRVNSRYGRVGVGEFRDAARRLGKPLMVEMRYGPGDADFRMQLERIRKTNAQAVVLWGDAGEMAAIVRQMRRMGMKQRIFACDRAVSPEFIKAAGPAAEGLLAVYPFNPESQAARYVNFRRRYVARFKQEPDWQAAHAYDGMNLILDAVRNAGLNRVRIRDWMQSLASYEGVTGHIPFDATLNDVGEVYLAGVRNGRYDFFSPPAAH